MRPDFTRFFRPELRAISTGVYLETFYATYTSPKRIVYPAAVKTEKAPVTLPGLLPWKFSQLIMRKVPEAFVLLLPRAGIYGASGAVVSREGMLLRDVSREFGSRLQHSLQKKKLNLHSSRVAGTVAVLSTAGGATFYHWLFDIIPRIHLIREAGLFEAVDFFVLPPLIAEYQRQLLSTAGVDPAKVIEAGSESFCLKADEVVVPSLPSELGTINSWTAGYLRSLFPRPAAEPVANRRRLYLTRRNAANRKLQQEDSFLPLLARYGFEIVEPENLSLIEQAHLFRQAEVVMGPHGSGFSNLVFCEPGTKVIELFSSGFIVPCFWILANLVHLDYFCAFDRGGDDYPLKPYWEGKPADLCFTEEMLIKTLDLAGLLPTSP